MTRRERTLSAGVGVLVTTMLLAACGTAAPASEAAGDAAALPSVSLAVLGEDATVDTVSWRGRPTVVNFWATWCAFCVEEMPAFQAVSAALGDQVRFVGVDREDRVKEALELARRTGVTYDLVEDPDGAFFRAVGGRGMPTTLFVDADGAILYAHAGPLTQRRLQELIDEHFGIAV
jgi:thiol-disulfide isomerase/thioredoxin